jgi:hypothetical protein
VIKVNNKNILFSNISGNFKSTDFIYFPRLRRFFHIILVRAWQILEVRLILLSLKMYKQYNHYLIFKFEINDVLLSHELLCLLDIRSRWVCFVCVCVVLGLELRTFTLSHSNSTFCDGYFQDMVLWTISLGWLQTSVVNTCKIAVVLMDCIVLKYEKLLKQELLASVC